MIRVFLLDDHEVVRRGIAELLTQDGDIEIVGSPDRPRRTSHSALHPDVAILDARLPTATGSTSAGTFGPSTNIHGLVLTSYDDDEAPFAASLPAQPQAEADPRHRSGRRCTREAAGQSMLDSAVTARVMERIRSGTEGRRVQVVDRTGTAHSAVRRARYDQSRDCSGDVLADKTVKNYVSSVLPSLRWNGARRRRSPSCFSPMPASLEDNASARPAERVAPRPPPDQCLMPGRLTAPTLISMHDGSS
jgi:CheY-like chemotaxis protein